MCSKTIFVQIPLLLLGLLTPLTAQDHLRSILWFNAAEYDSVIQSAPDLIVANPQAEGLIRYFLAESYYNKAIRSTEPSRATRLFQLARREFDTAAKNAELENDFADLHAFSKYKSAWSTFRLGEVLESEPEFARAHAAFRTLGSTGRDSIAAFAGYMAAESQIRAGRLTVYKMADGNSLTCKGTAELLAAFVDIADLYGRTAAFAAQADADRFGALKLAALLKAKLLNLEFARLLQAIEGSHFSTPNGQNRHECRQLAESFLSRLSFADLQKDAGLAGLAASGVSDYLDLASGFTRFYINPEGLKTREFKGLVEQLQNGEFAADAQFLQGGLLQTAWKKNPYLGEQVLQQYQKSLGDIESRYWLAKVQMTLGDFAASRASYATFLESFTDDQKNSPRIRVLVEDARYNKYLLDFEDFYLSRRTGKLKELATELTQFEPHNANVKNSKQQLDLLLSCATTRDNQQIWNTVLTGTPQDKVEQALATVQFILPRAALNIGTVRERYLKLLDRLLSLTEQHRVEETQFFSGIVKSLEAEIQPTPWEKSKRFEQAARLMMDLPEIFDKKSEAEYIVARSWFFADELEQATSAFSELVNRRGSLRALFYLGEIFRQQENGLAAKKCFAQVVDNLNNPELANREFWLTNSQAGFESAGDSGNVAVLAKLQYSTVQFQPGRSPDQLTYENLAEEGFLRQKAISEDLAWLLLYGRPFKDVYPSRVHLSEKLVTSRNYFAGLSGPLDEVRHPVSSTLKLQVVALNASTESARVSVDGDELPLTDGSWSKHDIALGSAVAVTVQQKDHYPFSTEYRAVVPGTVQREIHLNRKLDLVPGKRGLEIANYLDYALQARTDRNVILQQLPPQATDSELVRDFDAMLELRDLAWDILANRVLAVNSQTSEIWIYSSEETGERQGVLRTNLDIPLNSPEGIAVSSEGQIYVADWGNQRIVVLATNGDFLSAFGSFGQNNADSAGRSIKLTFPTRIVLVRGSGDQEQAHWRQDYLLVADRSGIHACTRDGVYLGTAISPAATFTAGSFYSFMLQQYASHSKLVLADRLGKSGHELSEFVSAR